MKKMICVLAVILMLLGCAAAENVYVTIADGQGNIALAYESIEVADTDGDGAVTIYDALYTAHETAYEGGAAAGFAANETDYGLSMSRLWGAENGGSYGYYVNNASAYSLVDPLKNGDSVYAFVYTDLEGWTDTFCFFDCAAIETSADFMLTLTAQGYDANWNVVHTPVAGAAITINGQDSGIITDANGQAIIDLNEPGKYIISAESSEMNLVPPVCVATIG